MKRIGKLMLVVLIIFLVAGTVMARGAGTAAGQAVELRWYQPEPIGHPWTDVSFLIAEEIERRSGGSLRVTIHHSGVLGSQAEAVDMLRTGSLALLTAGPSILASFYEAVQVPGLPYIFESPQHGYAFFNSAYTQRVYNDIILNRSGVRTLAFWYFGNRNLTTRGLRVNTPADLSGVRIRGMDTPIGITTITALGGNVVPIAFTELYLALQTGVVVGQENPIPTILAQRFDEVQDNIVLTGHSVHMGTVHVSEQIWRTLTNEQQRIITDVLEHYRPEIERRINESTEAGLQTLRGRGVAVYEPDLAAFRAHAASVVDQNFGHLPEWREGIEAARAARP